VYRSPVSNSILGAFLLTFITLGASASAAMAQDIGRPIPLPEPECGTRACVRAPCVQPPICDVSRDGVVRTGREVRVSLEGRVLRYEVTERWTNHGRGIGEADYVLPLPRNAAFEDLALEIDGEMVTGEALDANRARSVYEEIVRRKRDPALVEWMGMGLFRTRIFPIQPGETRTVVVRFRAVADREGDALRIDVPAPRGNGTSRTGTELSFRWPGGDGFGEPWSPTHRLQMARDGSRRLARVEDATGTVTLLVPVRDAARAAISVLTHAPSADDGYALITLTPPSVVRRATSRDITFVIDVSGSMAGQKLVQAKAAGRQFLGTLSRDDRFRLIAFSNDVEEFRGGWSPVNGDTRASAERWLEDLRANGGTNIGGALDRALEVDESHGRMALVLFLTDGAPTVGERRAERLAARAAELRGDRRIFTFGLGADLNAQLLEQVALEGAGTAHFVRPEEDVERVVGVVAERLQSPVATNLRVSAEGVRLHSLQPAGRLDLFAGQELTVMARYSTAGGRWEVGGGRSVRVTITGDTPGGRVTWESEASFPERRTTDAFVGRLWATQRVGWLSAERRKSGASRELDSEMKELGEKWGIPTELTSYLVLEPGMVANATPADVQQQRGRTEPAVSRRGDVGSGIGAVAPRSTDGRGGGTSSMPAATPDAAPRAARERDFEQAKLAAEMRDARSVIAGDELAKASGMRSAGNRTFVMRDGVWVDTRTAKEGARMVKVKAFSKAYFSLIDRMPELRDAFALGERVRVHGRAVTLELAADGIESLDTAALAAVTRDW
jgi:Ca-activated chloride channel family protein